MLPQQMLGHRYHFDITLYRAGFYQLIIEMVKGAPVIVMRWYFCLPN